MRCPLLRKGRPDTRQTANEYAANFRPRGTDFFRSSLAAQLEDEELAPADLTTFYHGHLKACRYLKLFIQKLVYEEEIIMGKKIVLRAGVPDDDNRSYLPTEIIHTNIVVNENGNNSQPWPEKLMDYHEDLVGDGKVDTWYEYIPDSYDASKKVPLVISLHGGLMTGWGQCIYTSWTYVAERDGFICVFPDASEMMFWCVEGIYESGGPTELDGKIVPRPPMDYRKNHDLTFVKNLIEKMKEKYNIDESRIFMQGMSMGNLMTDQFSRYYGDILAGAAGAGAATWANSLFNEDGSLKNVAGPVPIWQSRPEHNAFDGDMEKEEFNFKMNRYYWLKINECDTIPEISIVGEDNFAFYKGKKADLVYLDIKNRDHGQKLDEAFLYWDYFFSGLKRSPDGSVTQTDSNIPRKGDAFSVALAVGESYALLNGKITALSTAPVRWQKLKYHGLNGGQVVRGDYLMAPVSLLAAAVGGKFMPAEDTLTAEVRLKDGRTLQFARGSIGCMIDDRMRQMYVEAIHRNGELLVSTEWFFRFLFNYTVTDCNGVMYVTDHYAELSYFMADLIRDILAGRYSLSDYEAVIKEKVDFIR